MVIRDRGADIIRSKIRSIREVETDPAGNTSTVSLAVFPIVGTTEIKVGKFGARRISIANTHDTLDTYLTVSIHRQGLDSDESEATTTKIYIVYKMHLPIGTSVVFDREDLQVEETPLTGDETPVEYGVKLDVASGSPKVDVIVKS